MIQPKALQLLSTLAVLSCLTIGANVLHARGVKLCWPANPETNISGYVIYLGTNATQFSAVATVGNVTNYTITNLTAGQQYYAGVTALNDSGLESALTNLSTSFRINSQPSLTMPGEITVAKNTETTVRGISVSDDVAATNYTITFSSTRGTINVFTGVSGGVTAVQVSGNGSGYVSVTASLAAINATLACSNGVVYTGRLNLVGADTLIATVSDNETVGFGGAASTMRVLTVNVVGDSLDAWKNQNFAPSDLTDPAGETTVWGDLADPDQDGRPNLTEYALNLNPLNREPSNAGIISDLMDSNGKKYLTITFRQLKSAPTIQYLPQVSSDKQSWTSSAQLLSATELDSQTQLVRYQDLTPIESQAPRFMRLKIIRNQP